jgi:hypothetical protein
MFEKKTVDHISSVAQWKEPTMSPYATNGNGGSTYLSPDSVDWVKYAEDQELAYGKKGNTAVKSSAGIQRLAAPMVTVRGRTLSVNVGTDSKARIRVVNLTGRTIASFQTTGRASVSLKGIPAGAYVIEAKRAADGRKTTSSVVLK